MKPAKRVSRSLAWAGPALLVLPSLAQNLVAQQNTPSVPANLEELQLQRRPASSPANLGPTLAAPEDVSKAELVPGTLLSMDVYGVPEMSGVNLRLDANGDASIPTLGAVHLAGSTVLQAQQTVAKALVQAEMLVAPVVQLTLVQFAAGYVSVLGEVQSPGRFQIIAARNLAEVLALAGGETLAAGSDIEVQRTSATTGQTLQHVSYTPQDDLRVLQNVTVQPGDSVYIRRANVVYVLGAVNKPGGYLMVNGGLLNIYQALSLAGGTTLDAAKNGMYIIRPHDEAFQTIKVPFTKLAGRRPTDLQLQKNDVLYVPRSGLRVTFLDGSAILGAAVGGAMYTAR